jgi:hypothetical protein
MVVVDERDHLFSARPVAGPEATDPRLARRAPENEIQLAQVPRFTRFAERESPRDSDLYLFERKRVLIVGSGAARGFSRIG